MLARVLPIRHFPLQSPLPANLRTHTQYPLPPGVSTIIGVEFSGIVKEAGELASGSWKAGDEV